MIDKSWGFIDFCLLIFLLKTFPNPQLPERVNKGGGGMVGVILIWICQAAYKIEAN